MSLLLYPKFSVQNLIGLNLSGGKVYFYEAGTVIAKDTYSDEAFTVANTNPVVLDSRGEADIYINGEYKIVLKDADDVEISTKDNYSSESASQWENSIPTTFSTATAFKVTGNLLTDYHTGRRLKLNDASMLYGVITSSSYFSPDTTVNVSLDSGSLSASLTDAQLSILTNTNNSLPDITGKTNTVNTFTAAQTFSEEVAFSKAINLSEGANVASATDCDIWAGGDGNTVHLTGTTTVTDWGTAPQAGASMRVICDGITPLTFNATTNDLEVGVSYTTAVGDILTVYARSTSSYKVSITPYDGIPLSAPTAAQGSSRVLIDTVTASASATVDFTSGIDSTYDRYEIELIGVIPATNATDLYIRFSQSATFKTDTSYYFAEGVNVQGATGADYGALAQSFMRSGVNLTNSTSLGGLDLTLKLSTPDLSTNVKRIYGYGGYNQDTAGLTAFNFAGYYNNTGAIDGIQFLMSSGNISTGVFRLYGIKDA